MSRPSPPNGMVVANSITAVSQSLPRIVGYPWEETFLVSILCINANSCHSSPPSRFVDPLHQHGHQPMQYLRRLLPFVLWCRNVSYVNKKPCSFFSTIAQGITCTSQTVSFRPYQLCLHVLGNMMEPFRFLVDCELYFLWTIF